MPTLIIRFTYNFECKKSLTNNLSLYFIAIALIIYSTLVAKKLLSEFIYLIKY